MSNPLPQFERLDVDTVSNDIIDDFVPLLGQLSSSFAKKAPEQQRLDVAINLSNALEDPDFTAIYVHRDEGRIISTATANLAYVRNEAFGWVDDVVTLESARGRRLGRGAVTALHTWLSERDATHVYLTSAFGRKEAGNLYESMGYVEGGYVYRASLPEVETDQDDEWNSSRVGIELGTTADSETEGEVWVNDCAIPTGHKSWLDGLYVPSGEIEVYEDLIDRAHDLLASRGATSANVMFTPDQIASSLPLVRTLSGLAMRGYELRDTRLYELDLRLQAA